MPNKPAVYRPKVYTASKIARHTYWKNLRSDPDWFHVEWTARWIDMAHLEQDGANPLPADFAHLWTIDLQDIRRSDFVLLCGYEDSNSLRGALVEAGAAIALGKVVVCIALAENHSWSYHPLVVRLTNFGEARNFFWRYTIGVKEIP